MEIHELNNFTGSLDGTAFVAVDNGTDTGKASIEEISAPLNARIDNIIAGGDAPSEAEIIDARRGENGKNYSSLGVAIRTQIYDTNTYTATARPYALTPDADGYININDGQIKTSVSGYKNSGYVAINDNVDKLVVKNSFIYPLDGIAFYDADHHFIKGIGKDSFTDDYLIVSLPSGAFYFRTCWRTADGVGYVADYNGKAIEEIEEYNVPFKSVVNGLSAISRNTFNAWGSSVISRAADGSATLTILSGESRGFFGKRFTHTGGKLLHGFLDYSATNSNTKLRAYLFGTSKAGVANTPYNLSITFPQGSNKFTVDLDYLDVYGPIDISLPISILITNIQGSADTATVTKFEYGYYDTEIDSVIGEDLETTLANISNKLSSSNDAVDSNVTVAPNGTKYVLQVNNDGTLNPVPVIPDKTVFFGNSIILGFNADYGITTGNYFGMAASRFANDYYSKFGAYVESLNADYDPSRFRYNSWENATTEAAQQTIVADMVTHVDSTTQLVVVQLGDNVNTDPKKAIFESGARYMLQQLRAAAPNARVVWMGSWFNSQLINEVMPKVCAQTGCAFVPISDLNKPDNQAAVGDKYYDTNGDEFTIESAGVAAHPSDAGMLAIANRLAYGLSITDNEETIS